MNARYSANKMSANRCSAVACTSARINNLLDTALLLVVSICVLCLLPLRIMGQFG